MKPKPHVQTDALPPTFAWSGLRPSTSISAGLLLLALLSAGFRSPAAPGQGVAVQFAVQNPAVTVSVSGAVCDKRTGSPIPNAQVRAHLLVELLSGPDMFDKCPVQETVTDANGRYQFTFHTPLTVSGPMKGKDGLCVSAWAAGFETQPQYNRLHITAQRTSFTNFNFNLAPGKALRGRIVDPAGRPVSGALLRVQNGLNGDWNYFGSLGRAVSDDEGQFQLWIRAEPNDDLTRNPWLSVVKPGIGTAIIWDLYSKEELGAVALNAGGSVTGKVVGAQGEPVANCEVTIRLWPFDRLDTTTTDAAGNYLLKGIPGEPSVVNFFKKKNGSYNPVLGKAEIYARPQASLALKDAPHCQVTAQDGRAVTSPDLLAGADVSVGGALLPSKTALSLGGLLVRLDNSWERMVEADLNGQFRFPYVPAGKHTLTAYLPFNLRYDRGIGQTKIDVQPGRPLDNVQIQLLDLAELRVQYLDAKGNPLLGMTASATWSPDGDGGWTEGTISDPDGWAVLYLYPNRTQYIRGFDPARQLTAESAKPVKPEPGQVLAPLQVVMVRTATLCGRLLDEQGRPLVDKVLASFHYADGLRLQRPVKVEADGRFRSEGLAPGVIRLGFESTNIQFPDPLGKPFELAPGQSLDLGDLTLKDGVDKAKMAKAKIAEGLAHPQQITQAATELFAKIRSADYDQFLKSNADWRQFPIVGYYQTYQWFDVLVKWMSTTFKTNPIVNVELGAVFANPKTINRQAGLPTVPYRLTLKDGGTLQGNLPFEYNDDGGQGHWHGLEGIDWHLQHKL